MHTPPPPPMVAVGGFAVATAITSESLSRVVTSCVASMHTQSRCRERWRRQEALLNTRQSPFLEQIE